MEVKCKENMVGMVAGMWNARRKETPHQMMMIALISSVDDQYSSPGGDEEGAAA